jgi:hypothetical protein
MGGTAMLSTNSGLWVFTLPALATGLLSAPEARAEDRQICVVAILATDKNTQVDPRVKCIAEEVQKVEPGLTGFRVAQTSCKGVAVGKRETFALVDSEMLTVLLQQISGKEGGKDKEGERARLSVKAPLQGEIAYTTCCSKFFPIMTRYLTKDNERLIIAIMVKPAKKN